MGTISFMDKKKNAARAAFLSSLFLLKEVVFGIVDVVIGVVPHIHEEFRASIIGIANDWKGNFGDARFTHLDSFIGEIAKNDARFWEIAAKACIRAAGVIKSKVIVFRFVDARIDAVGLILKIFASGIKQVCVIC